MSADGHAEVSCTCYPPQIIDSGLRAPGDPQPWCDVHGTPSIAYARGLQEGREQHHEQAQEALEMLVAGLVDVCTRWRSGSDRWVDDPALDLEPLLLPHLSTRHEVIPDDLLHLVSRYKSGMQAVHWITSYNAELKDRPIEVWRQHGAGPLATVLEKSAGRLL